jgi:Chemoreceptor zinc-binding domain
MDLDQAIQKHAEWKLKFRKAISENQTMDVATISKDNCCDLGKWLHGEGKNKFSNLISYQKCLEKHAEFHKEAAKVARLINEKQYSEAEKMIGADTSYTRASSDVGLYIIKLKKEIFI